MSPDATIPKGATVLVTGANGLVGSHIVQQLLEGGYRVRGTVRSLEKSDWLRTSVFPAEAARGALELVEVPDMNVDGAYDAALRGVAAVIHTATVTTLDPDPQKIVPPTVAGVVNLLRTAAQESSVKSFVYTSSISAATRVVPDVPFAIDPATMWNEEALAAAYAPPPYLPERAMLTYAASKVKAEQAFWDFVRDEKPAFKANAVLPTAVFGPLLDAEQRPSTDAWIFYLFDAAAAAAANLAYFKGLVSADVRDVAALHVAAAVDPAVKDRRLIAWADVFNFNDALRILRKLRPDAALVPDFTDQSQVIGTADVSAETRILQTWAGRDWIPIETCLRDTIDGPWPVHKGVF